jgi:uncharacterized iron-regulated membrane protein
MKLRTLLFWPHLIAGVVAGTVILVMSVTGVLLTYERQLIEWSNSDYRSQPPSPDARRMPVEDVLAAFAQLGIGDPTNVAVRSEATDPVIVSAGPRTFYLDAVSSAKAVRGCVSSCPTCARGTAGWPTRAKSGSPPGP